MKQKWFSGVILLAVVGCSSPAGPSAAAGPSQVVVVGTVGASFPVYWVNGALHDFSGSDHPLIANAAAFQGANTLIGGEGDGETPDLWVNGSTTYWEKTTGATHSVINKILVAGADVWGFGYEGNNFLQERTWKNGKQILSMSLSDYYQDESTIEDAWLNGTDVYAFGTSTLLKNAYPQPTVWKNGVLTQLPVVHDGVIHAGGVSGGHVWAAGTADSQGTLWEDGVKVGTLAGTTAQDTTEAWGIRWLNGHQLVVGLLNGTAQLWTDGVATSLSTTPQKGTTTDQIKGLITWGNDWYAVGRRGAEYGYWRNGQFVTIPDATGVTAIAVR